MICRNCGTQNGENSKFCIRCGNNIGAVQPQMSDPLVNQNINMMNNPQQQYNTYQQQNINNDLSSTSKFSTNISISEYFFIILAVILKPLTALKQEINKFNIFKNSLFLSLIVSISATLLTLFKTIIMEVRVTSYFSSKVEWVWDNLKDIDYIQIIGKNFLVYLGMIFVVAGIYYVGSLIIKKQTNFSRLLGISALSIVPMLICSLVLSPLLSMIWEELAIPVIIVGSIYTFILFYEGINNELLLSNDAKYYFNLICLSILGVVAYYLCMKMFMGSYTGGLEDIFNLFG